MLSLVAHRALLFVAAALKRLPALLHSSSSNYAMKKVEEAYCLLDDLPNLATNQAYQELADSIFVLEARKTSKLEAWRLPSYSTIAQHHQQTKQSEVPQDLRHGTKRSDLDGRTSRQVELDQETITSAEELQAYLNVSGKSFAFFIRKKHSYSPLSISQTLYEQLCEDTGIGLRFLDYLLYLGRRPHEIEIAPPPLAVDTRIGVMRKKAYKLRVMGIIRFAERNEREDVTEPSSKWSIRQTAIFCRVCCLESHILWLFVSISPAVEKMLGSMWSCASQASHSPFLTLCLLYHFAVCNWRPYMVALVGEIDEHEMALFAASADAAGPSFGAFEMRHDLLNLEKKILTAKLAMQSTKTDLRFLQTNIQASASEHGETGSEDEHLQQRFAEILRDLDVNLMRIEQLEARLQGITNSLSSYFDWIGDHRLQQLTLESKRETESMRRLNKKMADIAEKNAEEAVTVTVLALLALIYLPLTVVSNFFSTSFVGLGASSDHIFITEDWWILFAVAIPLTILTIYVWWAWAQIKAKDRYPFWWSILGLKKAKRNDLRDEDGNWNYEHEPRLRSHLSWSG